MPLNPRQRRQLARRTTPTSRARLRARFTGGALGPPPQQRPAAPSAPRVPKPAPVASPTGGAQAPTAARTAAVFTPDAQYLAEAAQAQFNRTNRINQLNAEQENDRAVYQEATRRLMEGVPEQRQQISEQANRQGLFYSGQLGKRLGDLEAGVARQRADMRMSYDTEQRARQAARAAILAGEPLETAAMRAASVERSLAKAAEAASQNQLAVNPKAREHKPKPKPKPKPRRKKRRR